MNFKTLLINGALVLASGALTLTGVEIGLRLLNKPAWDTTLVSGWKYRFKSHVNELGYRGQSIKYSDGDIVVVLLGDSQVESMACPPDKMPERYLEQYLIQRDRRFKVFTVGTGGYGNDQEYLALDEYFRKYRADTVVLWETFSNDVWNNLFPTHWPKDGPIKPTFWLDHGTLKGPNYQLGEVIRGPSQTKIGVLINRWTHPQRGFDKRWERHLPNPYEPLTRYEGKYVSDWDPSNPTNINPILGDENLQNEKSHFSVELYPRSERMQYGLDLTRKLLSRIRNLAERHQSSFVIFAYLTPDEQQMLKSNEAKDVIVHKRDGVYYRTSFSLTMANMAYVNEGFTFFAIPILLDTWKVSNTDAHLAHLNCMANDQVMRDLAEKIVEHLGIAKSGQ